MSKTMKLVSLSAALVLSVGLMGGCSGKKNARTMMIEDTIQKATQAQMCCEANRDRIERLHEKNMHK